MSSNRLWPVDRGIAVAVLVVLLALGFSSSMALLGDVNATHAKQMERRWEKSSATLNSSQWQAADAYLHSALKLSPAHPDYLQALGRLSSWYLLIDDTPDRQQQAAQGLAYFRDAVKQRPYWAYGWSEFALLKAQAGQLDDEFNLAVMAALQQGPYEKQVLSNVLNAGLGVWPQLTLMQQLEVHQLFRRMVALHWTAADAMRLVEFHGLKTGFCYGLKEDPDVPQWVKRRCPN